MSVGVETRAARAPTARRGSASSEELTLYVALGDSFTAGTGCAPGEAWPERVAAGLRERSPGLRFRNLAVHGATSVEVLEQLPEALRDAPDLLTVVCGANDVLRSTRPDIAGYARRLAILFRRLRRDNPDVRIVTATAPDRWDFLELGPRTRARVERGIAGLNVATREIAGEHDVACLDVAGDDGLSDPANFATDGLHPSALGHERAAHGFDQLIRRSLELEAEERSDDER